MDIKQELAQMASDARSEGMQGFARVARDALEWIERLEGFGIHMLMVHENRTQAEAEVLIKDVRGLVESGVP